MMYTVIKHFTDLQDGNYKYKEGDVYPREGYTPSDERIAELASRSNRQRAILIQANETVETSAVEEPEEKPKRKSRKKKTEE